VYGNYPVQAFGTVLGRQLYFRGRHAGWSVDAADRAGSLPSDGYRDSDGFYREGDCPNAGWMPLQEAVKIIARCLREYVETARDPRIDSGYRLRWLRHAPSTEEAFLIAKPMRKASSVFPPPLRWRASVMLRCPMRLAVAPDVRHRSRLG